MHVCISKNCSELYFVEDIGLELGLLSIGFYVKLDFGLGIVFCPGLKFIIHYF